MVRTRIGRGGATRPMTRPPPQAFAKRKNSPAFQSGSGVTVRPMSPAAELGSVADGLSGEPDGADTRHGPGYYAALVVGFCVIGFALDGLLSTAGANPFPIFR